VLAADARLGGMPGGSPSRGAAAVAALLRRIPASEEARRCAADLKPDGELLAGCVALLRVPRAVCHLRQHY